MRNQTNILKEHYIRLAKKSAAWLGLVALASTTLVASPAQALQITNRSVVVGSSANGASTTYDIKFNPGTTGTIRAIKFQICTSPLELTSCTASNSSSFLTNTASFTAGTGTTAPFTSNWAEGTAGLVPTATSYWITYATGDSISSGSNYTVRISNVENPNADNTSYYVRIYTYSDAAATTQVDFGAMALSTARQMTVSANVQESLVFCVGTTGTDCTGGGLTGNTLNIGTGGDNVLSTSTPSGNISKMAADTNATTGYVIQYITTSPGGTGGVACPGSFSSSNDCITDFGGTAGTFSAGVSNFGINLRNNATPDVGVDISGSGSGTVSSPYNTVDNFAFQAGTTPRTVASATGATLSNVYNVAYVAQAGNTTKPGAYSATFTWICTGTF